MVFSTTTTRKICSNLGYEPIDILFEQILNDTKTMRSISKDNSHFESILKYF